jgi:prepilin-type N-terminal cleavage/methylation domain-containing protein
MTRQDTGFSLIELLVALVIALGLSTMMFHLFHENERVIRDQTLIMEMQQTARIVASQIADEIRMAGQGVPLFAASWDTTPSEAVAVILASSTASRIDFHAGLSNVETAVTSMVPIDFTLGVSRTLSVADGSAFSSGKYVYISDSSTWLRAEVTNANSTSLTVTPRTTGTGNSAVHFPSAPTISLEEAVSIYLNSGSVRRATANDLTNPAAPGWSAANEIGKNFTVLGFSYYDATGNPVTPNSLSNRLAIARVDIQLTVSAASPLSNGTRPTYSLALRTIPRNVRIRTEP